MKKLLLTLGTVAAAVAPITAVVACETSTIGAITGVDADGILTITGLKSGVVTEDMTREEQMKVATDFVKDVIKEFDKVSDKSKVVKVVLEGEIYSEKEPGELDEFKFETDFANVTGFANLGEAWDDYSAREDYDDMTGVELLVNTLLSNNAEGALFPTPEADEEGSTEE